jgi:hypothetical protein
MKAKGQIYLWISLILLVAIATNFSLRWSLMGFSTYVLAYATKGMRRSPALPAPRSAR